MKTKTQIGGMIAAAILCLTGAGSLNAQSWLTTGNAGTTSSNYIGTSDNAPLRIRTNNVDRIYISQSGLVSIGTTTQIGASSFVISNSVSGWCGMYLNGTLSTTKSFYGYASMGSYAAWHYYDPANGNWFLHIGAADRLTVTGTGNVGIGTSSPAYRLDVNGTSNFAGDMTVTGNSTVIGNSNVTGIIGTNTMEIFGTWTFNDQGINGAPLDVFNFNVASIICSGSSFTANKIEGRTVDSNPGVTGKAQPNGGNNYSVGVMGSKNGTAGALGMYCSGDGQYSGNWYQGSDARFKTNTAGIPNALGLVMQLKPHTYEYRQGEFPNMNFPSGTQYGFLAQELETVAPVLVKTSPMMDGDGKPLADGTPYKSVNYIGLVPVLTQAIQEQQFMIDRQDSLIRAQNDRILALEAQSKGSTVIPETGTANRLYQNQPNPTGGETLIRYSVNSDCTSAWILVRDAQGNTVKTIALEVKGEGAASFNAHEFANGIYIYELIVNGKVCDAKKMVITN